MKPILIVPDQAGALEATLAKVNKLATANTAKVADVLRLADRAELQLDIDELPKSRRPGAEAVWHGRGPWAQSYGYKMIRTKLIARRGRKGWYLVGAERVSLYPGASECFYLTINPSQRDWIVQHTMSPYAVRPPKTALSERAGV